MILFICRPGDISPPDDVTRQLMDILKQSNYKDNSSDSEDNTSIQGR